MACTLVDFALGFGTFLYNTGNIGLPFHDQIRRSHLQLFDPEKEFLKTDHNLNNQIVQVQISFSYLSTVDTQRRGIASTVARRLWDLLQDHDLVVAISQIYPNDHWDRHAAVVNAIEENRGLDPQLTFFFRLSSFMIFQIEAFFLFHVLHFSHSSCELSTIFPNPASIF